VCLDHGQPSKVESLWNPALKPEIERFVAAFAEHYGRGGVLESVLLGVSGIYGESIYPPGRKAAGPPTSPGRTTTTPAGGPATATPRRPSALRCRRV